MRIGGTPGSLWKGDMTGITCIGVGCSHLADLDAWCSNGFFNFALRCFKSLIWNVLEQGRAKERNLWPSWFWKGRRVFRKLNKGYSITQLIRETQLVKIFYIITYHDKMKQCVIKNTHTHTHTKTNTHRRWCMGE